MVSTLNSMLAQGRPAAPVEPVRSTVSELQPPMLAGIDMITVGWAGAAGLDTSTCAEGTVAQDLHLVALELVQAARILLGYKITGLPTLRTLRGCLDEYTGLIDMAAPSDHWQDAAALPEKFSSLAQGKVLK